MNTTPPADDPERDAMLRAALRHAPDRDARPPEAVSAQILHRARQAAAGASSSSGGGLSALLRWLTALTRPAPAAAFASLMLATVIGVMWQEGPPPESLDARELAAPQARMEAPKAAGDASADGQSSSIGSAPPTETAAAAKSATAPPQAAPRPEARDARAITSEATRAPAAAAPADSATAAAPARRADDEARRASNPRDAKTAESHEPREREGVAPASPQAAVTGGAEAARARSAPPAPTRNMLAAASDPLAPLAEGWAGASEAQRAALDELRRLSAGRWTRVPIAEVPPSSELNRGDGRPLGRMAITDEAVLWLTPGADGVVAWSAPLERAAAADLRRRLALPPDR